MARPPTATLVAAAVFALVMVASTARAQPPVPKPFPKPSSQGQTAPPKSPSPGPAPAAGQPVTPDEATLGLPIYPTAKFLASYDAGRGQRYFLFGTTAGFAEVVAYYKTLLKQKGDLVFEEPPTHMFEVGRFREETMAFPPSVTVKDYTWGGSEGYPNPKLGGQPARYRTVIQIVPIPAGEGQQTRGQQH